MTYLRTFRNGDPPALAAVWNRSLPACGTARPLTGHEFDTHVAGKPNFDPASLIVAEQYGRVVGFVHAGFGPPEPLGPPHQLDPALGTIAMLVLDADADVTDPAVGGAMIDAAGRYLRSRGAKVVYAGGQFPLNPFYWGLYGGSEWAGILTAHTAFVRHVATAGFVPVSTTVLLQADLTVPEVRDPRATLIRRQARLEVTEDPVPRNWWDALAIGDFLPTKYRLLTKSGDHELAYAWSWDMNWFGRGDGLSRIGVYDVYVHPEQRRKGFGRFLVAEILRVARGELVARAEVQTSATNAAALSLYEAIGFHPIETAILYRGSGPGA